MSRSLRIRPVVIAALLAAAAAVPLAAQDPARGEATRAIIREVAVRDRGGQPVPYALLTVKSGVSRVADENGIVELPVPVDADSAELVVRRIGYRPYGDWVRVVEDGRFIVELDPLPRALVARTITERRDTPLARQGFYERMERARRGATVARFITPEELDMRQVNVVSAILAGESYVKIERFNSRAILTGRTPGCALAVIVDGMRMSGMVEELYTREGQDEVRRLGGGQQGTARFLASRTTVDDLLTAQSVAAIELYPTAAAAPIELQRAAGNSACGILVIWSGDRR